MDRGIFLSASGLKAVKAEFNQWSSGNERNLQEKILESKEIILKSANANYDDLYLSYYRINLHKIKTIKITGDASLLRSGANITAVLDVDFPVPEEGMPFEDSLIDEFNIVKLKRFSNALLELVPYKMSAKTFGLGCVWFEYAVHTPARLTPETGPVPFLEQEVVKNSKEWQEFKARFGVVDLEINPQ